MLVGMTRFELATSGPPDRCATGLRHIPSSECACKKKLAPRVWLAAIPPLSSKPRASRMFFKEYIAFAIVRFKDLMCLQEETRSASLACRHSSSILEATSFSDVFQRIYCFRNSSFQGFAIVRFISSNLCERF